MKQTVRGLPVIANASMALALSVLLVRVQPSVCSVSACWHSKLGHVVQVTPVGYTVLAYALLDTLLELLVLLGWPGTAISCMISFKQGLLY